MGDILVLILLAVMVTVGMVMFVGDLAGLAINGYRSMRRAQQAKEQLPSSSAEADA